jgi:peptidoglycan/xylan/chitin deacetylase (PgdA/CDA1 family)
MAVLLFHRVTDSIPEDGLTVSTARFRKICHMLRRAFRVVPLGEIVRLAQSNEQPEARTVAITFDDCYRDNLFAARILAEYDLPACFFLPSAFVGTEHMFTWDRKLPAMPNLTWDDVREMAQLAFEIGSHTATHADLGTIDAEQALRELVDSKKTIEQQLSRSVRWFAYPFGRECNFRPNYLPLVQIAGYEACFSGHGGFIYTGTEYEILPREPVPYFHSVLHLELYLTGCLHWVYALKRFLRHSTAEPLAAPQGQAGSPPAPDARVEPQRAGEGFQDTVPAQAASSR